MAWFCPMHCNLRPSKSRQTLGLLKADNSFIHSFIHAFLLSFPKESINDIHVPALLLPKAQTFSEVQLSSLPPPDHAHRIDQIDADGGLVHKRN
jgi:hypothetical protein